MSELYEAILAVQKDAPTLPKDKTNPHFGSKYTPLDTIVEVMGPILNTHGLVWTTLPGGTHDEPTLTYRLTYAGTGEQIEGEVPLLLDKTSAQGMGSALTYMRRYSLCAVLNLVADDDDDGQAAGTRSKVSGRAGRPSDKQKDLIKGLISQREVTNDQLRAVLEQIGAQVEIKEGWLDSLSGGREGTASALITALKEGELPAKSSVEHPSDIPEPAQGEFEHEPQKPMETFG